MIISYLVFIIIVEFFSYHDEKRGWNTLDKIVLFFKRFTKRKKEYVDN